ncbi:MAG: ferritin-like domain-containing protein [Rhodothalassiaceae bacterium]
MSDRASDIGGAALAVLAACDAVQKAARAHEAAERWRAGALAFAFPEHVPERPGRPDRPLLLPPARMPRRRRAGSHATRIALLHAVAHIELNAIDLAFDLVARFGAGMPRAFTDDWVAVGADEARHFLMLSERLADHGAAYGDLPAHDGLWQAAQETSGDLMARLAIVPMVLEARGLDVTPGMIARFDAMGDHRSADVLRIVLHEEVGHVEKGQRWFSFLCERDGLDPPSHFRLLVKRHFRGAIKPPFNRSARDAAGLIEAFYAPLVGSVT